MQQKSTYDNDDNNDDDDDDDDGVNITYYQCSQSTDNNNNNTNQICKAPECSKDFRGGWKVLTCLDNSDLCRITSALHRVYTKKWLKSGIDLCLCGETQTTSHTVNSCSTYTLRMMTL